MMELIALGVYHDQITGGKLDIIEFDIGGLTNMITLTFAGDESGDVSFNFGKGASRYFVIALIATKKPQELREMLDEIRTEFHLPAGYEFGFNSMGSAAKLRQKVFNHLSKADFSAWAIIVDKTMLPQIYADVPRLSFYLFFATELLQVIPEEMREGATLILDEFSGEKDLPLELRRYMKKRNIPRQFNRVLTKRSKSEPLIQIADLVAGSVFRRDARGESDAYEKIQGKFVKLIDYQESNPPR